MTKRFGFTLAEVLITLGIIGVVAAMTMPTLLSSTQGAQYRAAYKKALSVINQAVVLNMALDDWNFADTVATQATAEQSIYTLIKNRMNVIKTGTGSAYTITEGGTTKAQTTGNYLMYFNDGIMFSFKNTDINCTEASPCVGFVDVNGQKGPNRIVVCDGKTTGSGVGDTCEVTNPTDVYPVKFYDQTMLPNSDAGRAVLYGK